MLGKELLDHLMRSGRRGDDLVFGKTATLPFEPKRVTERADEAWKAAGLDRITLRKCRHTAASMMIAAGIPAKDIAEAMGHADITTTSDTYGHLMSGSEERVGPAGCVSDRDGEWLTIPPLYPAPALECGVEAPARDVSHIPSRPL
jgi:integrase-like protein